MSAQLVSGAVFENQEVFLDEEAASSQLPKEFILSQSYPNPFNASTTIRYAIPAEGRVSITVYNILGQKVITLLDEHKSAAYYSVVWNGKDEKGVGVASGVYLYRIDFGDKSLIKRMTLLK